MQRVELFIESPGLDQRILVRPSVIDWIKSVSMTIENKKYSTSSIV